MPNIKSAAKRMKTSEKSRLQNKAVKTTVKHVRKRLLADDPASEQAQADYRTYCATLDKAAKKGVISRNTAIRRKRRAAERLRKAQAASAA